VSRTYDTVAPTVNITSTSSDPTNLAPFLVTIKFSEPVTGFLEGEMVVGTHGAVTNFGGIDDTYTFNLRINGQGNTVTVFVSAGVAVDAAGNVNSDSNLFSRTFDSAAPTVTINQKAGQADPTNSSPIQFTVVFSESTSDFTAAGVSVSSTAGATTTSIDGSGTTYTVSVTGMTISGTVTATIPAGAAHDAAGNASAASTSTDNTVTYDIAPPVFSPVAPATGAIINNISTASDVSYSLSEALASGSIIIAWESGSSDGGAPYTCTLVGTALNAGAHTAFDMTNTTNGCAAAPALKTGAVYSFAFHGTDLAGNDASTVTHTGILFDNTAPTVTLTLQPASDTGTSSADNITNAAAPVFNAAFIEPISGLANIDFTFTGTTSGCTFSIGVANVNTYPVTASNCTPGLMTIRMIADGVTDLAGNPILQTDGAQVTIDRAGPTVTLSSTAPAVTNISPIPVVVAFTEPVTGLLAAELTLSNGTIGEFAGSGANYTFNLYPSATGTVTVAIPGGAATDTAGNSNIASSTLSREYDTVAPTVTMISSAPANTNTSPIPVTVTFSKTVTGFTAGEIVPTNATVSGFTGTNAIYNFNLVPSGQGEVKADIAAGVAQDTAGNWNTAASTFSRVFDTVVPTVTFNLQDSSDTGILPTDNVTNAPTLIFDAIFSETVNGFTPAKLSNGGTATGCVYAIGTPIGNTYPITVTSCTVGSPSRTLILRLAAGGVTDLALNSNSLTNGPTVTIDRTAPGLTFDLADASDSGSSPTDNITNALAPIVNAIFTEPVYGIDLTDFSNSGSAGPCAIAVGTPTGNTYPLTFSACTEGTLVPLLTGGLITDAAGNAIGQTDGLTIQIDRTSPVTTMDSAITDPTSSPSIPITVSFTEPVVNFVLADITSVNGTLNNFSGSGAAYSFNLLPSAQGLVSASIAIGVSTDTAGNGNTAASISRTYDSLLPTVTLSSSTNPATNVSPIPVTVTFTEPVSGFISGDIIPGNATISNFSGSGAGYSFNLVPLGQGQVTASIPAGVAVDASGNGNVAPPQFSRTYDSLPPLVTFDLEDLSDSGKSTTDNLTNASALIVDAIFNEPISGLAQGDLSNTGTSKNCVVVPGTPIGNTVPLTVSSCTPGTVILRLAAGGVTDTAGNVNAQIDGQVVTIDRSYPTVTWTKPVSSRLTYFTYHQTVRLEVTATDNIGVDKVVFSRYNRCGPDEHIGTVSSAPYWLNYDTTGLCHTTNAVGGYDGNNEIDAQVYDLAGNSLVNYIMLYDLPALTVTFTGGGFGTVTSSPAGINCTKNCSFGWSVDTQLVTLTAAPNGTSAFTGWGGACTGTGTCQVTMGTLSQDRAVTATFVSTTNLYLPLIVR
jgi:hypothetical protein